MSAAEVLADVMRDVEQYLRAETDNAAKLAKSLIALKVARLVVRARGAAPLSNILPTLLHRR